MRDRLSAVTPESVIQNINAPVNGPVAARDVNVYAVMPWQWYAYQDSDALASWRREVVQRVERARRRIFFGPTAKVGWFSVGLLGLVLIVAVINMMVSTLYPPTYFFTISAIVAMTYPAIKKNQHNRAVDFAIVSQGREELLRIDMELVSRGP